MADFTKESLSTENLYNASHQMKIQNDEYTHWVNLVRTIHAPYKLFGLGALTWDADRKFKVSADAAAAVEQNADLLAWVEHRRWNAFLRSQGFECPTKEQLDSYFAQLKTQKNVKLKMHVCLVESRNGPIEMPESKQFDKAKYDYLDYVSMYIYHLKCKDQQAEETAAGLKEAEYKQWDYAPYDSALQSLLQSASKKEASD